ncbi:hypothetical protein UFOVP154_60 [uncultured Caudovirales phage]|uniref:Uncharacterized protein n=1 Tax=uncultured Caudovirales phage TaxID=2100421 RepID=A0A6J5KGY2_9CAUD|nr:hypothetical protein UFOVP8_45 [uncultured Caudovirales phage]CAB5170964.1 hypothetical protein UFOVP154_60 [uncultured Caudovirales phage]
MLDCSPAKIIEYRERYDWDFWQLRTPLTNYARCPGVPYGLDNGCFKTFDRKAWERLVFQAQLEKKEDQPVFVTLPDVVGDAQRTVELFHHFRWGTAGLKRCLVLQDGIGRVALDWYMFDAVFIGGTDAFKVSAEARSAARTAKMLGKWVHVGRVNTAARVLDWIDLADSLDGSGISRYDHMLEGVLMALKGEHPQTQLGITA